MSVTDPAGVIRTSAAGIRAQSEIPFIRCVNRNLRRWPLRDPWFYTPSGLEPCTFAFDTIINNQYKRAVLAAQCCPRPRVGVAQAPVWISPNR